jgi:pyridoxamine 5'-phosphate oxidase
MTTELNETTVDRDPFQQFRKWFSEMEKAGVSDVNAMTLATVAPGGRPSCRVVLLKDITEEGFSFYTNYNSRKAQEIENNPSACLNFFWKESGLQIRIEGRLKKTTAQNSDAYFMTRPRESRLGAWASPQSKTLDGRGQLNELLAKVETNFKDKEVVRPEWWGGYILVPDYFEFWLGRADRLHDRITYTKVNNDWQIQRIAP